MSFLGTEKLVERLESGAVVPYESRLVNNAAYQLCLGDQVYMTDSTSGKKEILDEKNTQVVIKPGQFALLLTKEVVNMPEDLLGFISIKFSQKIKGLVNISGFHVDPGFKGKIIFSVYNAGPATIVLDKGKPYFSIWLSSLTGKSRPYEGHFNGQDSITAEHISALKGELASPNVLLENQKKNEALLKNVFWGAGIIVTLLIAITVRYFWEESRYKDGYNDAMKERDTKEYIQAEIVKANIDSIVLTKMESVLKSIKNKNDSSKK